MKTALTKDRFHPSILPPSSFDTDRCLDPIWLPTHGGTERTRTVIDLIDNQVPHLSATVPYENWQRVSDLNRRSPD